VEKRSRGFGSCEMLEKKKVFFGGAVSSLILTDEQEREKELFLTD
jgi:hypothetical protein